jgi:hypothetical protein
VRGDIPLTIVDSDAGIPELPPERFEDADQVRQLCGLMIAADQRRAWMRERVDALVNGFPTYPKSVTAAKGFGWFPRVNYREAEGLIQAQQTPLFDLVNEVPTCIEIELDQDVVKASSQEELQDWENTIDEQWTWLLMKRWRKGFNYHIPLQQREMLVHGMGAHVWPNKRWIPRTPRSGQILFPEAASLDFETDGKYFMLRDWIAGEDVYAFIRNEKVARNLGWYPDNVWKTLVQAQRKNQKIRTYGQVEDLQRKARRGDIGYWSTSEVGLWFNWVFVAEYDGGYSLYAIEEQLQVPGRSKDGGYLFKKRFMFDEWPLVLFPYDIGTGDIHSVRGLGWRTKDFYELSNRVNNAMVAQTLIGAFPMVKQNNQSVDPDKLKLMRMGALNVFPYGVETQQWQFPPLANSGLALQQHLKSTLENNNQSFTGNSPEPKDRETRYSYQQRSQDAAKVANGMQSLYESNYQCLQDKMYRLCIKTPKGELPYQKMAQEFMDRCMAAGVPKVCLTERAIGMITEKTSTGAGSAALRLQALEMIMGSQVYLNAPEPKKIAIERATVAALMGNSNVDRFARSITDADIPDQDDSLAMVESDALSEGGQAIVASVQDHVTHAQNHLAKGMELAQKCEAGQEDPQKCAIGLTALLQHAGEHLSILQNNPVYKAVFQDLEQKWKELAQYLKTLQGELQSQNGQVPPQQQLSEEMQLKAQKMQGDMAIKQDKWATDKAIKIDKAGLNNRLATVKTTTGIQRDNAKTITLIQRDNVKTQASIQQSRAKAAATPRAQEK